MLPVLSQRRSQLSNNLTRTTTVSQAITSDITFGTTYHLVSISSVGVAGENKQVEEYVESIEVTFSIDSQS